MTTANTKTVGAAIAATPEQKTMVDLINSSTRELARALPKHLSPERLARIATTAIRQNPKLAQCTPASFMGALFTAAQLGLEPVAGLAYLIPFNNSKYLDGQWRDILEVQFVIGYKGVAELFYRHEKSGLIDWGVVHEKDELSFEYGTNSNLKHKPAQGERGKVIGYYGIFKLNNGLSKFLYMTEPECMAHGRKHSKTFNIKEQSFNKKSPWHTNPDVMCLKTVLIQVAKTAPMSTELRRALDTDETSREFKEGITDALDLPVSDWQEVEAEPVKELPKADTSKVADALTAEEIQAKTEAAKAQYHQGQEPTKSTPQATQIPPKAQESVTGMVIAHKPPKGRGPATFNVSDSDLDLKTFDTLLAETLAGHMVKKTVIEVFYDKVIKNGYISYMITGIAVQAD